ncbi:Calx-beta domain-containing protein, partial [Allomuricauda sp. d1]|uniref:Calx-beta domain-containing protein n=1 Tax=Allomuricauda sp. d1 TaxID=3136725 RepID=UPI0031E45773
DNESYDITVPIVDDSLIEPTEDLTVVLSNLSTTLIGINGDTATGNILDNDGGGSNGISFDSDNVTVNEGDGTATFTVRLTGNVQGGFTVDYATADGSAGEPGDYTATSGQLTFTGSDNESYDITVPIVDDSLIEPTEDFTVVLSNLSTTLIGINGDTATGNILDNDGGGSNGISFDSDNVTVNEGDGTATFTVRLTGNVQGGFTVDYATADGSAGEPGDYTATAGQLTFAGNDNESYDITVPIVDDSLIEPTEDFTVVLSNLSTTLIGINGDTATGNILDNDGGGSNGLSFDSDNVTVNEGDGTATFTVRLTGNVQGGFTVDYATADGSAGQPGDYTAVSGQLTFAGTDNESYDITVPIVDDSLIEATEDFTVVLSNLSTTLIGINGDTATGNILDNDGGGSNGISFDSDNVTVNEGDGTATFTVRLTGNVQGGFTVDYATADGSA